MKRIGGAIEGLILLVIGAYAGLLVLYGNYWWFLNPKFKWLTGTTAAMLVLVGTLAVLKPNKRPSWCRIVIFLLLLIVLVSGRLGIPAHQKIEPKSAVEPVVSEKGLGENQAGEISRVTMDGLEYIRINLAELYSLCKGPQSDKLAQRYVVRGIVRRSKPLNRLGQVAVLRNLVFCCLADSFGVGFRVKYDRLDELADGQWVEVYGTLRRLSQKLPDPRLHIKDMRYFELNDSHILVPTKIVRISEPEIPFIFEFRKCEPYAF